MAAKIELTQFRMAVENYQRALESFESQIKYAESKQSKDATLVAKMAIDDLADRIDRDAAELSRLVMMVKRSQ